MFGGLVVAVIVIVAGLTYFPAMALGPLFEHLSLYEARNVTTTLDAPAPGPTPA